MVAVSRLPRGQDRRMTRTIDVSARDKPRRSRPSTTGSSTMATTHASTTGTTTLAILKAMTTRAMTNSPTTEIRTDQFQRSTEASAGVPIRVSHTRT